MMQQGSYIQRGLIIHNGELNDVRIHRLEKKKTININPHKPKVQSISFN